MKLDDRERCGCKILVFRIKECHPNLAMSTQSRVDATQENPMIRNGVSETPKRTAVAFAKSQSLDRELTRQKNIRDRRRRIREQKNIRDRRRRIESIGDRRRRIREQRSKGGHHRSIREQRNIRDRYQRNIRDQSQRIKSKRHPRRDQDHHLNQRPLNLVLPNGMPSSLEVPAFPQSPFVSP